MGVFAAGQVALLPFPFSDLSRNKLRPAVLLAGASREDWIVCQITSNPYGDNHSFPLAPSDFSSGMLQHVSYVRPGKVFTAHESLIATVVGTLKPEMLTSVRNAVIAIIQ
ncbi:MAG TPA: type II toxin-antitoxin system PemK/MazF family toxin [Acidobacteriaceae bacterium]|jgi:mRNA interferase MazF|nr:type II toxin-antitoxin system PemK/MazF family toxin [Acidobacteriaceae bacterium]